jgi:hypothetical protein
MNSPTEQVTQETLEAIKSTAGIFASTGMQGVDLIRRVSLVPANVPARNNTAAFPRTTADMGASTASWRAWLNINSSQTDAAVGMDYAGTLALLQEQNVFAPYVPLAKAGRVTLDAVAIGKGFYNALADSELMTLMQLFISQDTHIINSQAWSLGTIASPTLTVSATGGSIANSTAVHVSVAARSGANYFIGGSSAASSDATITTTTTAGSTYSVTASIAAVKGAAAYDWFVGASSGAKFYYTTTTVATVVITSVITAAQSLPSLPLLSTTAPTTPPTADTSYSANWYNGVVASSLGDYGTTGPVTPGTGTPSGAGFIDWGGNAPSLVGGGVDVLDKINDVAWATMQLSPTAYMVNSLQGDEFSKLILASSSSTTFLPPTDADARTNLAGGGFIGRYVNRAAGGVAIPIEIHPRVAPGTIIARTDRVPFPGSNIGTAFEVRCLYDTRRFDYAAALVLATLGGGPRYDFEVRSLETLVNYAPCAQVIAANVA